MFFRRIAKKGGLQARLSVFPALYVDSAYCAYRAYRPAAMAVACLAALLSARENPMQSLLGVEYDRRIWLPIDAPVFPIETVPGFPASATSRHYARAAGEGTPGLPAFTADLTFGYLDLIRKSGNFAFDQAETVARMELATAAIPHLEIRFAADRVQSDLDIGNSTESIDLGAMTWGWTASVTYLHTSWLVPTLIVGGNSHDSHGNDIKALSLRGAASGWEWSLAWGEEHLNHPLQVDLAEYAPLSLQVQTRQPFRDLALRYRSGPWEAAWAGHWEESRYPRIFPEGYGLADSGSAWKQSGEIAFARLARGAAAHGKGGGGYRASLDFELEYGRHAFRGTRVSKAPGKESLNAFSYLEGVRKAYSLRSDLRKLGGRWEWGAYAGAAESELDALRPPIAYNHYFWDRNGVIDSYQGGLLGVFSNETWLFNGSAYLAQAGGGLWGSAAAAGWRGRLGLGYQHLVLETNSHLSQKRTTFLLAYQEERLDKTWPRLDADILTPELRLGKSWGSLEFTATAAQAVPIKVELGGQDVEARSGASGTAQASRYSGGTKALLQLGWRLP